MKHLCPSILAWVITICTLVVAIFAGPSIVLVGEWWPCGHYWLTTKMTYTQLHVFGLDISSSQVIYSPSKHEVNIPHSPITHHTIHAVINIAAIRSGNGHYGAISYFNTHRYCIALSQFTTVLHYRIAKLSEGFNVPLDTKQRHSSSTPIMTVEFTCLQSRLQ